METLASIGTELLKFQQIAGVQLKWLLKLFQFWFFKNGNKFVFIAICRAITTSWFVKDCPQCKENFENVKMSVFEHILYGSRVFNTLKYIGDKIYSSF